MTEYILQFHDNRHLYCDVLIKVRDLGENTYDKIYVYYSKIARQIVVDTFYFEDDGEWELRSMNILDEIDTVCFE